MKIFVVSRCGWTLFNFRAGLLKMLSARGTDLVSAGSGEDGYGPRIEAMGVRFRHLPINREGINPVADLRLFLALYRWYRQERPHVVHHFTIKPVIYGSIAAYLAGVPRIVNTITGLGYVYTGRHGLLRRVVDMLYRVALACADHVFFQNSDDLALFRERRLVNVDKVSLVPGSGVDLVRFQPRAESDRPGAEPVTVLMVSRLLRDKGIYEFVESARIARADMPGLRFQVLGEIDTRNPTAVDKAEVEEWQKQGLIEWLGATDDVRPYLSKADIVVLPSYREGMPRSLLEAAAMALPVVSTDVPGCRNAVDDGVTGLLVPAQDSQRLADAIIRLAGSPRLRHEMGRAGREKVVREFDETLVLNAALDAYGAVQ